jgi:hypothetical protein
MQIAFEHLLFSQIKQVDIFKLYGFCIFIKYFFE